MSEETKYYPREILTRLPENESLVEFLIICNNHTNVLIKVLEVFKKNNIELVSGFFNRNKHFCLTCIVNTLKSSLTSTDIVNELKGIDDIVEVKVQKPKSGVEQFHFPITALGSRAIVWIGNNYGKFIGKFIDILGTGGYAILYHTGYSEGLNMWNSLIANSKSKMDCLITIRDTYRASGWGIMEFNDINATKKTARVTIKDNIVPEALGKRDTAVCHDVRGYLAAIFSSFFNEQMQAIETRCIAKGDPYCEFIIEPREKG